MHLQVFFERDSQEPLARLVKVGQGVMVFEPAARRPRSRTTHLVQQSHLADLGFPHVEDVASLAPMAGLAPKVMTLEKRWRSMIEKYGLPTYGRWGLPTLKEAREVRWEISLKTLQDIALRAFLICFVRGARRADYLSLGNLLGERPSLVDSLAHQMGEAVARVLARHHVVSAVKFDREMMTPRTSADHARFAQQTMWVNMGEAFDDLTDLTAGVLVGPGGHPSLGFYARGWWALMVIDALQPRPKRGEGDRCDASDCPKFVRPGQKFCSSQCRERTKKRFQRVRAALKRVVPKR